MTVILLVVSVLALVVSLYAVMVAKEERENNLKLLDTAADNLAKTKNRVKDVEDASKQCIDILYKIKNEVLELKKQSETITQLAANDAVSDAMDQIDIRLENSERAINALWQSIGTQKKRLDKIDPPAKQQLDPVENLKHQQDLMDKMLKKSTDAYAEKLKKAAQETMHMTADREEYDIPVEKPAISSMSQKYFDKLEAWKQEELDKTDILDTTDIEDTADFDLSEFFSREKEAI